ncbi:MAG: hypothetical protein LBT40_09295 [Deltaproteobacteria bacterium]|jgi:hypothetical protein|nr:hypothetical protein [Deltaproteobacteria bacterium]
MASSDEFIAFVCGLLEGAGTVRSRRMFGESLVYLNDKPAVLVCDDVAFVKVHPCLDGILAGAEKASPYPGAKDHYVLDVDDAGLVMEAVLTLEPHLEVPKPRKKAQRPHGGDPGKPAPKGAASESSPKEAGANVSSIGKAVSKPSPKTIPLKGPASDGSVSKGAVSKGPAPKSLPLKGPAQKGSGPKGAASRTGAKKVDVYDASKRQADSKASPKDVPPAGSGPKVPAPKGARQNGKAPKPTGKGRGLP